MDYKYKNLVFEGGGIKGIAYLGVLRHLELSGAIKEVERIAGTSAGAIFGTLIALGYTSQELETIIRDTNFKEFADGGFFPKAIYRTLRHYGWHRGDKFREWMGRLIEAKTCDKDYTFGELAKVKQFKNLYVVTTNISRKEVVIFSHETTPNIPIRDAVRMSASVPVFFKTVKYNGDHMTDGGLTMNYPVHLFDFCKYISNTYNGIKSSACEMFNTETLGFRLDTTEEIEYNKVNWKNRPVVVRNFLNLVTTIIELISDIANKKHLTERDWNRTVFIDTGTYKPTDFKINEDDFKKLIAAGFDGMNSYYKWKVSDPYWSLRPGAVKKALSPTLQR
jgi:NTE family protein